MRKGLISTSVFSAILLIVAAGLNTIQPTLLHTWIYGVIIFLWIMNMGIQILTDFFKKMLEIEPHMLALAGITVRLMTALFALMVVALLGMKDIVLFAINFSVVYLLFLIFEITTVLSNLRPNSSQERQ